MISAHLRDYINRELVMKTIISSHQPGTDCRLRRTGLH